MLKHDFGNLNMIQMSNNNIKY